jgi:prophage antirepressor-like protein
MSIVNESGLYSLILKSRKPEAREFKKWVTGVVLPSRNVSEAVRA